MPSWNIHIAHAERLLEAGPIARAVRDRNAFLFGNLVPDIYVGYMVPGIIRPIPYRVTHFAAPEHIPKPREGEFWDRYVEHVLRATGRCGGVGAGSPDIRSVIDAGSLAREVSHVSPSHAPSFELQGDPALTAACQVEALDGARDQRLPVDIGRSVLDLVVGAWTHLLADTIWNQRANDFLDALGEAPSRDFRIKKQGDFDQFGKSLKIDAFPLATPRLLEAASVFPQYAIDDRSAISAAAIAHEIVRANTLVGAPSYRLLTEEFFSRTFNEVQDAATRLFGERFGDR